ncbi:hypothetical protein FH972_020906 [Carpinus fangiana]|uniref:Patatin n=1 Tax=Carpinus fangiana TaxID=176857 RepID=A0A5N6RV31_9ROSI|nr:hypothetical protein FH972_020906 [Carpinus fangiana]
MLTSPNEKKRPLFAAEDIKDFYVQHSPNIFPQNCFPLFNYATKTIKAFFGPKYNGKYLRRLLKEKLGNTKLDETLTNVVIPTYDIKQSQPTIFSSFEVNQNPSLNALLSDICIGTSAAPTYLPPHYFETKDPAGNVKEFNLIDGGIVANNPASLAVAEVSKELKRRNSPTKPYLLISIGTGSSKAKQKYNSHNAAKWGLFSWLIRRGSSPIVDAFTQSSAYMVDLNLSTIFGTNCSEECFLRIQDDTLSGAVSSVDIATKKNLDDLVKFGERLLKKPVTKVNLDTKVCVPSSEETVEKALRRFAKILSDERRLRLTGTPHDMPQVPN